MSDVVAQRVLAAVSSIVGSRPINTTDPWRSIGVDSLDLLTLITIVEDEFDLAISDPVAAGLHNVADIIALVVSAGRS